MRPRLLAEEGDFRPEPPDRETTRQLVEDLHLATLWAGMARGDDQLYALVQAATLTPLTDPGAIAYRQEVLGDCLENPVAVREFYDLAREAVAAEQSVLRGGATARLSPSLRVLELFCDFLRRLGGLAAQHGGRFRSPGMARLMRSIQAEVGEDYLRTVEDLLGQLEFEHGIVVTARLGDGNKGVDFRLHEPPGKGRSSTVHKGLRKSTLSYAILGNHEEDWRALAAVRGRVLDPVANAASQSADHVLGFFLALRDELGFYLGCVNLADTLDGLGLPICWPEPHAPGTQVLCARELYEPCLAVWLNAPVVGTDVAADGVGLIMITGRNRGGKSTFLRGLGVAQLMMQCGMFVAARQFRAATVGGIFTHFKREEDRTMSSGKLDEELGRMRAVVDDLTTHALVLCNESFFSTNEREGSDISAEIIRGLTELGARVVFVTHLYDLARRMHGERPAPCLFLTAERGSDGSSTYRLVPGDPSPTAQAVDLYARVFGGPPR